MALGFAAVPLYDLFCRATGFGGTTQVATEAQADLAQRMAASAGGQTYSIRFDANTARDMPWDFRPVQVTDTVAIGQRDMATYIARNNSSVPITGTATFNVEPEAAGRYFNKIQCFCFTEQTLQPGRGSADAGAVLRRSGGAGRSQYAGGGTDHTELHLPSRNVQPELTEEES